MRESTNAPPPMRQLDRSMMIEMERMRGYRACSTSGANGPNHDSP